MNDSKISYRLIEGLDQIGVNRTAGYRAIADGELRSFKVGRCRMVTRAALEDFIARRERESSAQAE